jgi:hypothetical protein
MDSISSTRILVTNVMYVKGVLVSTVRRLMSIVRENFAGFLRYVSTIVRDLG